MENQKLFALLIDGDNVSATTIRQIWPTLKTYGDLRISKVFHNKSSIDQWEQIASEYGIEPIWVPNNTKNKNIVDIALVMEAMTLFYERADITGFCIISTDGDYTRLARMLKSEGMFVLGIGEAQTPTSFRTACTTFVNISDLAPRDSNPKPVSIVPKTTPTTSATPKTTPTATTIPKTTPKTSVVPKTTSTTPPTLKPASAVSKSSPSVKSKRNLLYLLVKAYQKVSSRGKLKDGWTLLTDVTMAIVELSPEFKSNLPELTKRIQALATNFPKLIELSVKEDGTSTLHVVRLSMGNDAAKFLVAYHHLADDPKYCDSNGWVTLSMIGNILRHLFPSFTPRLYQGTRYSQLKKVIEKMGVDNPGLIEVKTEKKAHKIRFGYK